MVTSQGLGTSPLFWGCSPLLQPKAAELCSHGGWQPPLGQEEVQSIVGGCGRVPMRGQQLQQLLLQPWALPHQALWTEGDGGSTAWLCLDPGSPQPWPWREGCPQESWSSPVTEAPGRAPARCPTLSLRPLPTQRSHQHLPADPSWAQVLDAGPAPPSRAPWPCACSGRGPSSPRHPSRRGDIPRDTPASVLQSVDTEGALAVAVAVGALGGPLPSGWLHGSRGPTQLPVPAQPQEPWTRPSRCSPARWRPSVLTEVTGRCNSGGWGWDTLPGSLRPSSF